MHRIAWALLGVLIACESSPRRVQWQIEFDAAADAATAVNVQAYVAAGGCEGLRFFEASLARGEGGTDPGPLVPGRYGFGAEAFDVSCRRVASSCVDVDWPPEDEIRVVLSSTTAEAACEATACVMGRCEQLQDPPCGTPGPCSGPVAQVRVGRSHSCARTEAGQVWCWGRGEEGQLGRSGATVLARPVSLPGSARAIAVGGSDETPSGHSCAVVAPDGVWCWGDNSAGQAAPSVQTATIGPTVVSNVSAITVAAGGRFTCALATDGVQCWGAGEQFQRGDATMVLRGGPVLVPLAAIDLGLGEAHACARSE